MYERFTREARRALVVAQQEVRDLGAGEAGVEHLLLALTKADAWVGDLLQGLGATYANLRSQLPQGPGTPDVVPLDVTFKLALEVATRLADRESRSGVGPEHLLLGVVDVGGAAAACLREVGVDPDDVARRLRELGADGAVASEEDELQPLFPIAPPLAQLEGDVLGTAAAEPRCPSCRHAIGSGVRHVRVPVDIEVTVDLVYCGLCGHVLTTRIVERG